jgi:hypothetical protein
MRFTTALVFAATAYAGVINKLNQRGLDFSQFGSWDVDASKEWKDDYIYSRRVKAVYKHPDGTEITSTCMYAPAADGGPGQDSCDNNDFEYTFEDSK